MAAHRYFCVACGARADTGLDHCANCGSPLGVTPTVPITFIATGFAGKGRGASEVLVAGDVSGISRYDLTGSILTDAAVADTPGLVAIPGLESASRPAALLACCDPGVGFVPDSGPLANAIIRAEVATFEEARTTAACLAGLGAPFAISRLPFLSDDEIVIWQALGALNQGSPESALELISRISPPCDLAIVITCVVEHRFTKAQPTLFDKIHERFVPPAAGSFDPYFDRQLPSEPNRRLEELRRLAGATPPLLEWLESPTRSTTKPPANTGSGAAYAALLHTLESGVSPESPTVIPPSTPLSIVDQLIEIGAPLDTTDFLENNHSSTRAEIAYLRARLAPWELTDEEVDLVEFDREKARRKVLLGDFEGAKGATEDPQIRSLVEIAQGGISDENLERLSTLTPLAEQLKIFQESPDPTTLSTELVSDPTIWGILGQSLTDGALWWPAPEASPTSDFLSWFGLTRTFEHLADARYDEALHTSRQVLKLSTKEDQRDEALNLLACAHWMSGNDDGAKSALVTALEGSRNSSLQVNLGIVSATDDPETAALELARLVRESTSPDLRMTAAMRAVSIWIADDTPWQTESDPARMPEDLSRALRSVILETQDADKFRILVRLASTHDSDWLAEPTSLQTSPLASSPEARLFSARAHDLDDFVQVMTDLLQAPDCPDWVSEERDGLIDSIISNGFEDINSSAILFGLMAIEKGLPTTEKQRSVLVPMGVIAIAGMFLDSDDQDEPSAPADRFTDMLEAQERQAKSGEDFESVAFLYETAWAQLSIVHLVFIANNISAVIDAFNSINGQIASIPRRNLNRQEVNNALARLSSVATEIRIDARKWALKGASDPDVTGYAETVLNEATRVIDHIKGVMY